MEKRVIKAIIAERQKEISEEVEVLPVWKWLLTE